VVIVIFALLDSITCRGVAASVASSRWMMPAGGIDARIAGARSSIEACYRQADSVVESACWYEWLVYAWLALT